LKISTPLHSRRVLAATLCAVAAVPLAGCNADEVGAAAVVGGDRITISELQQQVRDLAESAPEGGSATGDQENLQLTILERMIQHELLSEVARAEGVEVSEAEVDTYIQEQIVPQAPDGDLTPLLAQNGYTEETFREAVRDQITADELSERLGGQEAFVQALGDTADEIGVEVSPRYGSWSGVNLEPASGSISEPGEGSGDEAPAETPAG